MHIPEVREIIHRESERGEFFTVLWMDGTKTIVKLAEGEQSDEYTAFLYALGKKIFGDKGVGKHFVKAKKKVFEDRVARRSAELQYNRKLQSAQKDFDDINTRVYAEMFVAPCLVSKAVFRRNK